ncbi:MAG: hypothetical protein EVB08_09400 [Synechococcus sp. MED-G135]|nr:MAG: hypothetical protein EVB08_09400 [Synechococcus sp. MED-G135]
MALVALLGTLSGTVLAQAPLPDVPNDTTPNPIPPPVLGSEGVGETTDQDQPLASPPQATEQSGLDNSQDRLSLHEEQHPGATNPIEWLPLHPSDLLAGGGLFVALISLASGITAHLQLRRSHQSLRRNSDSLRLRLSELELQLEQDRAVNRTKQTVSNTPPMGLSTATSAPKQPPTPTFTSTDRPATSPPSPAAAPKPVVQPPAPALVSKAGLITAINSNDRQQLRDAAEAELNITSESENAIATGRAVATELEVVPGGGSYWLLCLDGQHWLFPTDRTLKGFAAAQPAKGLFRYEQQTIAQPQLIEPAQLEASGERWTVRAMGRIATPS